MVCVPVILDTLGTEPPVQLVTPLVRSAADPQLSVPHVSLLMPLLLVVCAHVTPGISGTQSPVQLVILLVLNAAAPRPSVPIV